MAWNFNKNNQTWEYIANDDNLAKENTDVKKRKIGRPRKTSKINY